MKKVLNTIFWLLSIGAFASLAFSCSKEAKEDIPLVKLGAGEKTFTMEVDGGIVNIPVYSNGSYHLEMLTEDNEWLSLKLPSERTQNGYIRAECDFNASFRRQAIFTLCSDVDSRCDTIVFRQKGLKEAVLSMENRSLLTKGAGGDETFAIVTNVPSDKIVQSITYSTDAGMDGDWIQSVSISSGEAEERELHLTTLPNPDNDIPRSAQIRLKFIDGWGETTSLLLNVIQRTALEKIGTVVSMDELKNDIAEDGKPIDSYVIVEGIVVSDRKNRNAGDNEQLTPSTIDYTLDQRTIYLESLDGTHGICLITSTIEDNQTSLYDHVQVLLFDTMPEVHEEPFFLTLNNVKASMFISQSAGQAYDVPAKQRYIKDLADNDIFTRVTLRDVEIPVRKGDLMPVNEGYTIAANGHRLTKYPRLVRDINGDHLYLYTNTTCQYRNDGTLLPYGSGTLSGVIVHERFPRYEWENMADPMDMDEDPLLGRIGAYQIRPQVKDDIWKDMQADVENSFSKLLTEYRYWNPDTERGVCLPTYGTNGWFTHTYQRKYTGSDAKDYTESTYGQHFSYATTYDYAGPKGKNDKYLFGKHIGNENGLGIVMNPARESWNARMETLVDATDPSHPQWCGPNAAEPLCRYEPGIFGSINYTASANIGKGIVPAPCYTAFASDFWWDYEQNRPFSWLLNFSTAGISASNLSLQISQLNTSQSFYAPRYWKIEWATTDNQSDFNWQTIVEYTVPDVAVWSTAMYHSISGFKQMDFPLPTDMLGKENVYIRISPANDICSSGADYADAHMNASESNAHTNAINYIAVRYN